MAFTLTQKYGNYRDFEPAGLGVQTRFGNLMRITFDDNLHTAYGSIANPAATLDNDEELSNGETVPIPWQDAIMLLGTEEPSLYKDSEVTVSEALENALTFLESLGYKGGDIHDDLELAIDRLRSRHPKTAASIL